MNQVLDNPQTAELIDQAEVVGIIDAFLSGFGHVISLMIEIVNSVQGLFT